MDVFQSFFHGFPSSKKKQTDHFFRVASHLWTICPILLPFPIVQLHFYCSRRLIEFDGTLGSPCLTFIWLKDNIYKDK